VKLFSLLFSLLAMPLARAEIPTQASAPVSASISAISTSPMESILSEDYIRSLRDPFRSPTILAKKAETPKSELETFQLKEFKLNGVIATKKKSQAMITAPNGKGYFLSVGDKIGVRDGRVTSIQPQAIKVVEYEIDEKGKRVPDILELRMDGEVVSLSKKEQ
jgi:Tfp pilus assembly protein PilP